MKSEIEEFRREAVGKKTITEMNIKLEEKWEKKINLRKDLIRLVHPILFIFAAICCFSCFLLFPIMY